MKKLLILVLAAIGMQYAGAQVREGKILFEQKIDMHRRIPEDNAQLRAMVPPFRTNKFELSFADSQSVFKAAEEEPDMSENNNNGGMVIRMRGMGNQVFYKNFNTSKQVELRELAEKEYILEDSIRSITWKLTDETEKILGYTCKKATGKTANGNDVEAWYTEEIQLSSGPEFFSGLPGMILKADINKQEIVFTATELQKTVSKKDIKAPSKGKKISKEDFAKLQKELFGDRQGGGVRIVTN